MFHESLKKQFHFNLMLRHTVKLTLNYYFIKYSERKILQCILPFTLEKIVLIEKVYSEIN